MKEPAPARDFGALHAAMQRWVDEGFLAGVSLALFEPGEPGEPGEPAHVHCAGLADRERGEALREDHLFRMHSCTKLVTSVAVLQLVEQGKLAPEDPVERFLPALGARQVLKPGATSLADTVPARGPITIAQLLSHSSGLSYGLLDPGTLLYEAYTRQRVLSAQLTLEQMVDALAPLPLAFEPGTQFEYSIATDVLARVVEVVSGQRFDAFLHERIFAPLGMADTGFVVPAADRARLAAMYVSVAPEDPARPGLLRAEDRLTPPANLEPAPRLSGGGGLVSTLPDMVRLLRSLMPIRPALPGQPGPPGLLREATLRRLQHNLLPAGCWQRFPTSGVLPGRGHGLASGLVIEPAATDHPEAAGTLYWGGMAGTQWWISPRHGFAGVLMTQRLFGYADPFVADLKRESYRAMLGR